MRMVYLIALVAGGHFVLSSIAMNIIMGLRLHPPNDPNGPLQDTVASGLEWILFFPYTVLFDWIGFNPSSDFLLLTVNTLCWCLIIIPIAIMIWIFVRKLILRTAKGA